MKRKWKGRPSGAGHSCTRPRRFSSTNSLSRVLTYGPAICPPKLKGFEANVLDNHPGRHLIAMSISIRAQFAPRA
jgi:hypothetical protein